MDNLFAVTAPGASAFAAQELRRLELPAAADDRAGGVAFSGEQAAIYRANLHLRSVNRVLMRLGSFQATSFAELRRRAARLPWERCLAPGQAVALRVTCHKSKLYHSDGVAERVAGAIGDRLGSPPAVGKFDEESEGAQSLTPQLIIVRLQHDQCTISIDSSGALLHRRGYRLATAKAPLRETLAATMLLAAGWELGENAAPPLLDPFCGSGTIAIEAALLALDIAPGLAAATQRRFAFMEWPDFDAGLWQRLVAEAQAQAQRQAERRAGKLHIVASDRDAGAIAGAQANAVRAGVAEWIEFVQRPVSALTAPEAGRGAGWIVTNPPYGLRVSANRDVRNLYAQFGHVLRAGFVSWHVAVLSSERRLLGQLGLRLDTSLGLVNGGTAVLLARGVV